MPIGARYWGNQGGPLVKNGMGNTDFGISIVGLVVYGALGYVAGRAMAPTEADRNKYGWWGAAATSVFGVGGLAIQGAIALSKK